jgi:hypothetical protein
LADASENAGDRSEDPGWHLGWRALVMMLPGGLQWQVRRAGTDSLAMQGCARSLVAALRNPQG